LQKLNKIYRANYGGERITTEAAFQGSEWLYKTEWVPTAVANNQLSKIATIIGNGSSRKTFPTKLLMTHLAGRLGAKSMQTYACNAAYRDINPTFLVAVGNEICDEIADSGYCDRNIVYTNSDKILKYPNKFYLIPQDYVSNAGTVAAYLACFDGHEKIYLLGFDNTAGDNYNNNIYAGTPGYANEMHNYSDDYWILSMEHVMSVYSEVEFVRVTSTPNYVCPSTWRKLPNFRQISFNQYIIEADLGVT
jgi:hypothetical protein